MSKPIRVLLIITRLELGGAQRVVLHTAEHLDREGFAVGLAWGPGDRLDDEVFKIGDLERFPVPALVRPIAPISDARALAGLRAAVRAFRPQVVHTHSSKAGILGRLAAHLERIPVVVHTVHGFGFTPLQPAPKRIALRMAERLLARWTDHFITVSASDRRRGIELGLFASEQATVIRAGIDLGRFRAPAGAASVRERLGLPADVPLITQIGNFKPQKAPLDFVRMASIVRARFPEAYFVMVGEGPMLGAAKVLAGDLGLAGRMVFCGWWDDVPGLLAATRVSVLTSYHEGLPCSVVESLAAGVPVVVTSVDGTVEVVRSGDNGFLAPAGDVEALAEGVCRILEDPHLHASMSAEAPRGLEDFAIDLMVRQQEDLYRWLGGRSPS
ncbi:MAG: glycosyltransferase family 4 protein [Acidobacteria bacterium]|nr:glycosyltransferase family 4 protein [Acidobacteriota bacterium]